MENCLTDELQKEQEQAIETAIIEEETWLKELAKEENTAIDIDTENESDLGVSIHKGLHLLYRTFIEEGE